MPLADDHQLAFINSFVLAKFRDRLRAKPRQFLTELCHVLPTKIDPRFAVALDAVRTPDHVVRYLNQVHRSPAKVVYLSAWSGQQNGEYPIPDAVDLAEESGGAIVSLVAGSLAFYVSEHPNGRRWLLVGDAQLKQRAQRAVVGIEREQP